MFKTLNRPYMKEGNFNPKLGRVYYGLGFPAGTSVEILAPAMTVQGRVLYYRVKGPGYRHTTGTDWMEQVEIELDVPAGFLEPV